VAVFQPGQTCALEKNKAPNFRSLHEDKELVSFTWGGHELLTVGGYGLCRNYLQLFCTFSVRKNTYFLFLPMHPPRHGL